MGYMVRRVELEDWEDVKFLWETLKTGRHCHKLDGADDDKDLRVYFKISLTNPSIQFIIARDSDSQKAVGFGLMSVGTNFAVRDGNPCDVRTLFVRAVYVLPFVVREATMELSKWAEEFAKSTGCVKMFGNCRLNFPTKAAEKLYGWKPSQIIMEKEIK